MRHGDAGRGARDLDVAALGAQHARLAVGAAAQRAEGLVELGVRPGAERRQIDVEVAQAVQAIVVVAAQLEDLEPLLDQVDEGQEAVALQAVLVEIVGLAVGGGDHREALVEQRLEQARQDHGVGDVGDLELVEAEQPRFAGDLACAIGTMVSASGGAPLAASSSRRRCRRSCTSSMNSWKCTRRFLAIGASAKNRSISIDLPRPTGPQM